MDRDKISKLFTEKFSQAPEYINPLPPSGSSRKYYRLGSGDFSCIGTCNMDTRENDAFVEFARSLYKAGLPVPEIYIYENKKTAYLQEDLGDWSLLDEVERSTLPPGQNPGLINLYKQALTHLVSFQMKGRDVIDFSLCVPRDSFDWQSMHWDLNHFKYYFVKISGIPFDEQKLENDFRIIYTALDKADRNYFMFRDFQSRNIMIRNNSCYFIDFQGGRKGALFYDVASLLFEAKTHLPFDMRDRLLEFYMDELEKHMKADRELFRREYFGFVLIRVLQALGAYGLRGLIERKSLFLQSIPYALKNIEWLLTEDKIPWPLPELQRIFHAFINDRRYAYFPPVSPVKLRIEINSFSYRKNLPYDTSGNGGGFIFDCRALENPGLVPELKEFTGKDPEIEAFFASKAGVNDFLEEVFSIVSRSIKSYEQRQYKHLQVNFGCTGGRHRSVYAAEKIARKIKANFDVEISLVHRDLEELTRQ